MNINQELTLNLSSDGIPPRLHMVQGDANTRTVVATLWDGAQPYTVPAASAVMIRFRKPDGTGGLYDTTESGAQVTVSGNTVTAPVATQMLAVAGVVQAQVDIYGTATGKAAEKLATFRFAVEVAPSVYPDAEIISSDYFNIIAADIGKAVEAAARAESASAGAETAKSAAEDSAEDAEAWAVGQRNGADVPSTDPTYHNNAKYYKDQAQTIAGGEFVSYGAPQTLTDAQKQQARDNINAPAPYEAGDNIAITGRIITTKAFPCNPKLTDNWYWGNPVNQRGWAQGSTNFQYSLDRWISNDLTVSVNDGYVTLTQSGQSNLFMVQRVEANIYKHGIAGRKVTISALLKDGQLKTATVIAPAYQENTVAQTVVDGLVLGAFSAQSEHGFRIFPDVGQSFDIVAVGAELGSQQTLCHKEYGEWVLNEIPKFGDQLAECQRYYQRLKASSGYMRFGLSIPLTDTTANVFISLAGKMRTVPAMSASGNLALYLNNTFYGVTLSPDALSPYNAVLVATGANLPSVVGQLLAQVDSGAYIEFSADL